MPTYRRSFVILMASCALLLACSSTEAPSTNDTSPPVVTIVSPPAGDITGPITVTADASDNLGVVRVTFTINGILGAGGDTEAPYEETWDPATLGPGTYTWKAIAWDAAGNSGESAPVDYKYFPTP